MAAKKKEEKKPAAALPEYRRIPLARILEPELPARATMSDPAMRDLEESLRAVGQIEPITVEQHDAMYAIITGHRRFLAARAIGWAEMSALVYREGAANRWAMMAHENRMREALNPAEEAIWMAQAREQLDLDEAGLCDLFRCSADHLGSRFALLRGDPEIFACLQRGEVRLGVAHELNRITDESMRRYYLDAARRADPPARVVHMWVTDWMSQARAQAVSAMSGAAGGEGSLTTDAGQSAAGGVNGGASGDTGVPPQPFFGCQLCGGDRDPFNLIQVMVHRWEWEHILRHMQQAVGEK